MDERLSFFSYGLDGSFIGEFTSAVRNYQQEWELGPLRAEWDFVTGVDGIPLSGLAHWFNTRLMTRVEVRDGGEVCWAGYIWAMELSHNNTIRTRSMQHVVNAVKVQYEVDVEPGEQRTRYTDWYTHDESIKRYGIREGLVRHTGDVAWGWTEDGLPSLNEDGTTYTELDERAAVELQYQAEPYSGGIVFSPTDPEQSTLHFTAVGAAELGDGVLLSDGYLSDTDSGLRVTGVPELDAIQHGDETTVGAEIRRICAVLQYATQGKLFARRIEQNGTATRAGVATPIGAITRLRELAKLRHDRDRVFFRLFIEPDGGITYEPYGEAEPDYVFYGGVGKVTYLDGTAPLWSARPGLVLMLDDDSPVGLPDTWLKDKRLQVVERVTVRDGDEVASFMPAEFDIGDVYGAIQAHLRWMERD